MSYLIRRGSTYYFNVRLPLWADPNRSSIRLSLQTSHRRTATLRASTLAWQLDSALADNPQLSTASLRAMCLKWRAELPQAPAQPSNITYSPTAAVTAPSKDGTSLKQLVTLYLKDGSSTGLWRESSKREVTRSLDLMIELIGDGQAASLSREDARKIKERLFLCPRYFALKPEFAGQTITEVINSGSSYERITPTTVQNVLRRITAFLNWCVTEGYLESNPMQGMKVPKGSVKEARLSLSQADITTLLDPTNLSKERSKHPWRMWLPTLARYTGARLEELCQLTVSDIEDIQGITCIRIDNTSPGQQLKNESSRRYIPIHPQLLALGFLEYVGMQHSRNNIMIFPELVPVRGKLGHAVSKWFSRYKNKVGIIDSRKTFHSFRHTFIDDMRDAQVPDSLIKRLVGHEDSSVTFKVYGSRVPIRALYSAISKI